MSKVAIVTDSTVSIPSDVSNGLPIHIIPVRLVWGDKSYADNIDLQPAEFYNRLKIEKETPRTSQITTFEFVEQYKKILDQGYEILSIHVSSRVSGTINSAMQAIRELATNRITVLDSLTGAAAMGFQVIEAARAAVSGATVQECLALAERVRDHCHIYFVPGTLEFLHRGGRIGGAATFLGSVLKIHPILETRNGVIEAVERVRTMSRAMQRVVELVEQRVGQCKSIRLAGLYADIPQLADQLVEVAHHRLGIERIKQTFKTTISPALGTHIGPGSVGIAYTYYND